MINFVPHVVLSDQAVPGLVYARNQWTGGLATFDAHAFVSTRYEIKDGKTTTDAVPVGRLAPGTIFYTGENRNGSTRLQVSTSFPRMYQSTATAINFAGRKGDDMTKGWRNNIALVERRDRLARERAERRVAVIKAETAAMMDDGGRFFLYGDGQVMYAPPPEDWRSHYPDLYGVTT